MQKSLIFVAALGAPAMAQAQALSCTVPSRIERPHAELPSADQPVRRLPIGSYTLALTWAPEYCLAHRREPASRMQCGSGNHFGFTLHGLWPDGVGKDWPQYCTAAQLLPERLIAQHLCATPSAQLLQHEWAKHGTCMPGAPADYFTRSTGLYAQLKFPDMDALSRRQGLTAGTLIDALATANPGLPATAIRVTVNPRGWLDELWLCLDKRFGYERCRAGSGGVSPSTPIKIWRGRFSGRSR